MRKILLLSSFLILSAVNLSFAGTGKGIIPSFSANSATYDKCVYYISNITGHDLEVTVTFYDQDGNVVTSGITYTNFMTSNTVIGAGKTGIVTIYPSTWKYGYGTIEWNNTGTDQDVLGLVSLGMYDEQNSSSVTLARYTIPINGGAAF